MEADGLVCVGGGDSIKKIGFVTISAYHLSLYVDPVAAASALGPRYKGCSHAQLASDAAFYKDLVNANFAKRLKMQFTRNVTQSQLQSGMKEPIMQRVTDPACQPDIEKLLASMVDMSCGDVMNVEFAADGAGLRIVHETHGLVLEMSSRGLWLGFQQAYFDENTVQTAIKAGAVRDFPSAVFGHCDNAGESLENVSNAPSFVSKSSTVKKSWRDFSRRSSGRDGYKFGDLTRGVVSKVRKKKETKDIADNGSEEDIGQSLAEKLAELETNHAEEISALGKSGVELQAVSLRIGALLGMVVALLCVLVADFVGFPGRLVQPAVVAVLAVCCSTTAWGWSSMRHLALEVASACENRDTPRPASIPSTASCTRTKTANF
eukprot:TRINITY_DN25146_c0_g1_i1.p1 TRINITY_DN25146_c0_g1~~TRINITY_DN25146_c0_g1_i1.p1  ORF type:complete len:402 (+),score=74.08 TRINITY_DN25146_c0_g1_i1:78-1208(+)